jgi:hypothetical protein
VRLRPDLGVLALGALLLAAPAMPEQPVSTTPSKVEIDRAVEAVKADPNLAAEKTIRTLTWDSKPEEKKTRKATHFPKWLSWIGDLFLWIGQASQMLVYLLLATLAALLILFIVRLIKNSKLDVRGTRFVAPTHVQDLDIRPESLPPNIGAAARALWDRGEQRAALALLYRGLLSRLAHVHEVPIRDSSTEGDCLALAARKLDTARTAYATLLVRNWQRAIYGGIQIDTAVVHELCAGFALNLDAPDAPDSAGGAAFAGASA